MLRTCVLTAGLLAAISFATPAAAVINEEAKLFDTLTAGANGGTSISVSGDTAVIGAPSENGGVGGAYVFIKDGGVWVLQEHIVLVDGSDVPNGVAGDLFGKAVSLDGDNLVIGAPGANSNTGAAYTSRRSGLDWSAPVALPASGISAGDQFAFSVGLQGATIVAGAPFDTVAGKIAQGSIYVFVQDPDTLAWSQQAHIVDTRGVVKTGDHIGWSVAVEGNTAIAGAPDDDFGNKVDAGTMYVYVRNGGVWSRQARLNPKGTANERVGSSVAIFSNTAIAGGNGHDVGNSLNQGIAFVYNRVGTSWTLQNTLTASDAAAGDHFGTSVALGGAYAVVGAPQDDPLPGVGAGKAYLFALTGANLTQIDTFVATDNAAGDNFGTSVAFDVGRGGVGAPNADASGVDSGAGYVFEISIIETTTQITSVIPEPSLSGTPYTVSVTVSGSVTPTGTVDVSDGDGGTCTVTLNLSGSGSCQLTTAAPGDKVISAN